MGDPGWGRAGAILGDIITGGAKRRAEDTYQKEMGASIANAMNWNKAVQERAKAVARDGLGDAVSGYFEDPKEAALANAILGSADTMNMHNLGGSMRPGYRGLVSEQAQAMKNGDYTRANAITDMLGGKEYHPVTVNAQGVAYDPSATLGDITFKTTPVADAAIGATNTLGTQRLAAADASRVRAGAYANNQNAHAGVYRAQEAAGGFSDNNVVGQAKQVIDEINAEGAKNGLPPLSAEQEAQVMTGIRYGRPINVKQLRGDKSGLASILGIQPVAPKPFSLLDSGTGFDPSAQHAPQPKLRSQRIQQINGKPVVSVSNPAEAKAAWNALNPGGGLMLPNGTIKWK